MTTLCFILLASRAVRLYADASKSFRDVFDDVTSDDLAAGPSVVSRNIGGKNIIFGNVWKNSKFPDTSMSIVDSSVELPLSMSIMMEPPDFDYFMSLSMSMSSMSMSMSLSMSMLHEDPNVSLIDGTETQAPTKTPSTTPSITPTATPSTAPTAKPSTAPTVEGKAEIVLTYRAVVSDNLTSAILNDPDSIYQVELLESISMWATETVSDFKRMESKKMFTLRRLRKQTPTDAMDWGLPIYHRRLMEMDGISSMKVIDVGEYERTLYSMASITLFILHTLRLFYTSFAYSECSNSIKARIECGCYIEGETIKLALHNSDHCIEVLTNVTISLKDKLPITNKTDIVNFVEDKFMLELEDPEFHSVVPLFIKREIRSIYSSHLIESTIPPAKDKYLQSVNDNGLETPLGSLHVFDYAWEMDDDDFIVENEYGRPNKVYITAGVGALALMVGIIGLFVYHRKQRYNASSDKSIVGDNTALKDGHDSQLTPRSVQYDLQPVEDLERGNDDGEGSKAFSTKKEGSEAFSSRKDIGNWIAVGATSDVVAIESYDASYSSGSYTEMNYESEDESERSDRSDVGLPPLLDGDNSTCTSSSNGSELADAVSPLQTSSGVSTRRISELTELTISSDDFAPIFASTIELAELRLLKAMKRADNVSECSPKHEIYSAKKELCEAKENVEALRMMIKSTLYAGTSAEGSKSDVPSLSVETAEHTIEFDTSHSVNSTEMVDRALHQIVQSLPEELIQHIMQNNGNESANTLLLQNNANLNEGIICIVRQIVESDDFVKLLIRSGGDVNTREMSETDTTVAMTDSSHTTLSRSNSSLTIGDSNKCLLYQIVESLPDDFDTPSGSTVEVVKQVLESEGSDSNSFSETMDDEVLTLLYRRFVRQFEQSERSFDGDNSRAEIIQYRQGFKYAARNTFNIIEMIMTWQSLEKGDDESFLLHNTVQNISCSPDLLRFVIETNMEMVAQSDSNGNLPLHYAALVATKSSVSLSKFFITELLYAYPAGAGMTNAVGDLPINLAIESRKDWIGTGMLSLYEAHPHGLERNVNEAFLFAMRGQYEDHIIPAELDNQVDQEGCNSMGVDGGGGRYRKRKQRKMISKDECLQSMLAVQNPDATVRDIAFTMWANEEDEAVQILGCSALELAVTDGLSTEKIASIALLGVTAVVNAMRNHPNEPTVQGKACSAFIALSPAEGLREVSFAASGAITSIVTAMKTHLHDATIQEEACKALQSIIAAGGSESATVVACVGGFSSLVHALAAHPHDSFVQIEACLALELLTSFYDKYERHEQIEQLLQAAAANYPDDCLESTNAICSNLLRGRPIEVGNKCDVYDLDVTECGIHDINGRYHQAGLRDDAPQYVKIGKYHGKKAMFHLSRWQCATGTRKWYIIATVIDGHQERHLVFYVAYETNPCSAHPPMKGWMAVLEGEEIFLTPKYKCNGTNPVPVIHHRCLLGEGKNP